MTEPTDMPALFAHHWERTEGDILECVRLVLEAHAMERRRPPVSVELHAADMTAARRVIAQVATAHGLTSADLRGRGAAPRVRRARYAAMLMVRLALGLSYPLVGLIFGGRNHSTVICSCKKAQRALSAVEMRDLRALVGLDGAVQTLTDRTEAA